MERFARYSRRARYVGESVRSPFDLMTLRISGWTGSCIQKWQDADEDCKMNTWMSTPFTTVKRAWSAEQFWRLTLDKSLSLPHISYPCFLRFSVPELDLHARCSWLSLHNLSKPYPHASSSIRETVQNRTTTDADQLVSSLMLALVDTSSSSLRKPS